MRPKGHTKEFLEGRDALGMRALLLLPEQLYTRGMIAKLINDALATIWENDYALREAKAEYRLTGEYVVERGETKNWFSKQGRFNVINREHLAECIEKERMFPTLSVVGRAIRSLWEINWQAQNARERVEK